MTQRVGYSQVPRKMLQKPEVLGNVNIRNGADRTRLAVKYCRGQVQVKKCLQLKGRLILTSLGSLVAALVPDED